MSKADCLTAPREITYDAALAQLLSNPIHELRTLRSAAPLGTAGTKSLAAGQSMTIFEKAGATAFDLELNLTLTDAPLAVSVALLGAAAPGDAGCGANPYCVALNVTRGPTAAPLVTVVGSGGKMRTSFALPHGAATLELRALVDRSVLEVFVGGGRAAITSGVGAPPETARGAYVTAHSAASVAGAGAWAMGCGWAQ